MNTPWATLNIGDMTDPSMLLRADFRNRHLKLDPDDPKRLSLEDVLENERQRQRDHLLKLKKRTTLGEVSFGRAEDAPDHHKKRRLS